MRQLGQKCLEIRWLATGASGEKGVLFGLGSWSGVGGHLLSRFFGDLVLKILSGMFGGMLFWIERCVILAKKS